MFMEYLSLSLAYNNVKIEWIKNTMMKFNITLNVILSN